MGPDPLAPTDRRSRNAELGIQRASHVSKHGGPMLIPEAADPDDHTVKALGLEHPFAQPSCLPLDLQFGVEKMAAFQIFLLGSASSYVTWSSCAVRQRSSTELSAPGHRGCSPYKKNKRPDKLMLLRP